MYLGLGLGLLYRPMAAGAPAPLFAPTNISNLKLWLDASDTASLTQVGGAVSQWSDKSGNGNHATQGTGVRQPMTGTRTINGLNGLDFDGSNDQMVNSAGLIGGMSNTPLTLFIVHKQDTSSTSQVIFEGNVSSSPRLYVNLTSTAMVVRGGSGANLSTARTANTNTHISGFIRSGTNVQALYDGPRNNNTTSGADQTYTSCPIGYESVAGNQYFDGIMGEIIVYASALSNSDVNLVGNYLATKWGTTWTNL